MIVENGTGLEDSNSYCSIGYADDYFTSHGVSKWGSYTTTEKEVLLVKASDFVDNIYDWYGIKSTEKQSMNFPRTGLFTKDGYEVKGIPKQLKDSVCEAVNVLMSNTELFQTASENGAVISETIGSLSFSYDVSQKITDTTLYDSINKRLRGLYKDNSKKKIYSAEIRRKL